MVGYPFCHWQPFRIISPVKSFDFLVSRRVFVFSLARDGWLLASRRICSFLGGVIGATSTSTHNRRTVLSSSQSNNRKDPTNTKPQSSFRFHYYVSSYQTMKFTLLSLMFTATSAFMVVPTNNMMRPSSMQLAALEEPSKEDEGTC